MFILHELCANLLQIKIHKSASFVRSWANAPHFSSPHSPSLIPLVVNADHRTTDIFSEEIQEGRQLLSFDGSLHLKLCFRRSVHPMQWPHPFVMVPETFDGPICRFSLPHHMVTFLPLTLTKRSTTLFNFATTNLSSDCCPFVPISPVLQGSGSGGQRYNPCFSVSASDQPMSYNLFCIQPLSTTSFGARPSSLRWSSFAAQLWIGSSRTPSIQLCTLVFC